MRKLLCLYLCLLSSLAHAEENSKAHGLFWKTCRETYQQVARSHGVQIDFNQNIIMLQGCQDIWLQAMAEGGESKRSTIFKCDIRGCEAGFVEFREHFDPGHQLITDRAFQSEVRKVCLGKDGS